MLFLVTVFQPLTVNYLPHKINEISLNFLVLKFCGNAVFGEFRTIRLKNCAFPQNFNTRKLGEISVFYAVIFTKKLQHRSLTRSSISLPSLAS